MLVRVLSLSLLLSFACGGSDPEPAKPEPVAKPAEDPEAARKRKNEERLAEAQKVGCEGMCPRLSECALAEAKKEMTPKEVKELEEIVPRHTQECTSKCMASSLSVKQVSTLHACLREDSSCSDFTTCLDGLNG